MFYCYVNISIDSGELPKWKEIFGFKLSRYYGFNKRIENKNEPNNNFLSFLAVNSNNFNVMTCLDNEQ